MLGMRAVSHMNTARMERKKILGVIKDKRTKVSTRSEITQSL